MILTKAGIKLWVSGMLVILTTAVLGLLVTDDVLASMSLGEMAFVFLVVYPLAIGWTQRWMWTPKVENKDDGIEV